MRSSQLCSSSCAGPRLDSGRVRDDDEVVAVVVQHGQKMPNLLHVLIPYHTNSESLSTLRCHIVTPGTAPVGSRFGRISVLGVLKSDSEKRGFCMV